LRVGRYDDRVCSTWEKSACKLLIGNLKKRDHMEDIFTHGKIILKWNLKK
jgi:hypothetical protein